MVVVALTSPHSECRDQAQVQFQPHLPLSRAPSARSCPRGEPRPGWWSQTSLLPAEDRTDPVPLPQSPRSCSSVTPCATTSCPSSGCGWRTTKVGSARPRPRHAGVGAGPRGVASGVLTTPSCLKGVGAATPAAWLPIARVSGASLAALSHDLSLLRQPVSHGCQRLSQLAFGLHGGRDTKLLGFKDSDDLTCLIS